MYLLNCVREVGVHLYARHIRYDKKRRVLQRDRVTLKLREGRLKVFVLAFIFPRKTAATPHVRPAIAAACLLSAAFEAIPVAVGVNFCGSGLVEHATQIYKV